jgi:hypothetical protein
MILNGASSHKGMRLHLFRHPRSHEMFSPEMRVAAVLRVLLFLGLIFVVLDAAPAIGSPDEKWVYTVKNDFEGDPQMALARLRNDDGSAALWISCVRTIAIDQYQPTASLTATVIARRYLGHSGAKGRSTVVRFDERPPDVAHWMYRERYGQLRGEDNVKNFISQLAASEKLVVELSDYRYETLKSEFALDRSATRLIAERFTRDCKSLSATRN